MQTAHKIRVLIVDDSIIARRVLLLDHGLSRDPRLEVVGHAINASDARRKIALLKPDVLTLDVEMPGQSGLEFLKNIFHKILFPSFWRLSLISACFDDSAGAVDFVRKPDMSLPSSVDLFQRELALRLRAASRDASAQPQPFKELARAPHLHLLPLTSSALNDVIIALGASTGGTEATLEVLRHLPANTPGIVIVQHMPVLFYPNVRRTPQPHL